MEFILKTHNLSKKFKNKTVIDNINLKVKKGEIYGLLGENGAGKTTLLKLITNIIKPTSGKVEIFGKEIGRNNCDTLRRIGSMIGKPMLYEDLTARENLKIHAEYLGYYKNNKVEEALQLAGLNIKNNEPLKKYSLGMKQRLSIAKAVLTKPELLILDEPINFLDPKGIRDMTSLLYTLSKEYEITILMSSHILSQLEQIVDTIGIIKDGLLKTQISIDEIHKNKGKSCIIKAEDINSVSGILADKFNISRFKIINENEIKIYESEIDYSEVLSELVKNKIDIDLFHKKQNSLEDYFLDYIEDKIYD